jgi:phosphatidylcholine synthase
MIKRLILFRAIRGMMPDQSETSMKPKVGLFKPNQFPHFALTDDRMLKIRAWTAHFYTSLGLVASLLALIATAQSKAFDTFLWLAFALFIDSTDGMWARRCGVGRWTPNFDGRKLDDIIDYLTYVLIPTFFAFQFHLVTIEWLPVLCLVLLASAYGFCNKAAKTNDGYFTGFPSYWNVLVFYLYLLKTPTDFNQVAFLVLALLVFVPIKYLYPTQAPTHRKLHIALAFLWGVFLLPVMFDFEHPNVLLLQVSTLYPIYYMLMSFYLHFKPRFEQGMRA